MKNQEPPYIFLDTCSLLASCWNGDDRRGERIEHSPEKEKRFWGEEFPALLKMGKVILPLRNYEELQKHSGNTQKKWLAEQSKYILNKLEPYITQGAVQIVGDPNDPFADAILLSVALKFRTQHNMAFITQDRKLAEDLWAIQHFRSVEPRNGQAIKIRRISRTGALERHKGLDDERGQGKKKQSSASDSLSRATKSNGEKESDRVAPKQMTKSWWED